MYFLIQTN